MAREPRGTILSLRMTDQEQQALRKLADEQGISLSEYLRTIVQRQASPEVGGVVSTSSHTFQLGTSGDGVSWTSVNGHPIQSDLVGNVVLTAGD